MSSDTIADMLSMMKNASMVGKSVVELPYSKNKEAILKVLKKNDYIENVKTFKEKGLPYKSLKITLAYEGGDSRISDIKRVSKPGLRVYKGSEDIKKMNPIYSMFVVSTPKGVMSGEDARSKKLGGEVILKVS